MAGDINSLNLLVFISDCDACLECFQLATDYPCIIALKIVRWFASNKGAGQPAHSHKLIGTFVIHVAESIKSRLATSEISIF